MIDLRREQRCGLISQRHVIVRQRADDEIGFLKAVCSERLQACERKGIPRQRWCWQGWVTEKQELMLPPAQRLIMEDLP